jgi:hypothetical protein
VQDFAVPVARSCVFCGGDVDSREHVYPDWLTDELPGEGIFRHEIEREGVAIPPWSTARVSMRVRQVCGACNNGWMSRLETRAKPLIGPMTRGEPFELRTWRDYATVTAWGYKTALMLALTVSRQLRYVPANEFTFFYERRRPPSNVVIWIAAYLWGAEPQMRTGWSKPQKLVFDTGQEKRHGYVIAFNVGALVFQLVSDPFGGEYLRAADRREDMFLKIWPLPPEVKRWPPNRRLSEAGLDELGEARVFISRPTPATGAAATPQG